MTPSTLTVIGSLLVGGLGAGAWGCSDAASASSDAAGDGVGTDRRPSSGAEATPSPAAGQKETGTAPAPPGETTAPATATESINSLDEIVSDMRLGNDLVLRGYEDKTVGWYVGPGYVQMGNDPRTSNTPDWWKKAYPNMVNDNPLRAFLPWIVLFDGQGHAAANTRVQFRDMQAFYKSKGKGTWISWGRSPGVSGYATPKIGLFGGSISEDKRVNVDGSVEVKPPLDPNLAWHGWWDLGRITIDPLDVDAVFVTVQARLVVDDNGAPDDRDAARLLFHIGADYYIDAKTSWPGPQPGVGVSRAKLVTKGWQAFSFMTFSDVGEQDPGGGISEATFRAAPPPLM